MTHYLSDFQDLTTVMSTECTHNDTCSHVQAKQVDLVQLHWWDYGVSGLKDVILTLGDLQSMGMVKSIGVTNFDTHHLEMLTDLDVPIVSNQVHNMLWSWHQDWITQNIDCSSFSRAIFSNWPRCLSWQQRIEYPRIQSGTCTWNPWIVIFSN